MVPLKLISKGTRDWFLVFLIEGTGLSDICLPHGEKIRPQYIEK
jgi:hypothetical protein